LAPDGTCAVAASIGIQQAYGRAKPQGAVAEVGLILAAKRRPAGFREITPTAASPHAGGTLRRPLRIVRRRFSVLLRPAPVRFDASSSFRAEVVAASCSAP
jgi:hypothetical protein